MIHHSWVHHSHHVRVHPLVTGRVSRSNFYINIVLQEYTSPQFNLQLPRFAQTAAGAEVLNAFSIEFAQTWDLVTAYHRAVDVSLRNGSFLQFQMALWWDMVILGMRLIELAFQQWRNIITQTRRL